MECNLLHDFETNYLEENKIELTLVYDAMKSLAYSDHFYSEFIIHRQSERYYYSSLLFKKSMNELIGDDLSKKVVSALKEAAAKNKSKIYDRFIKELGLS
jgi:hypothetical protein